MSAACWRFSAASKRAASAASTGTSWSSARDVCAREIARVEERKGEAYAALLVDAARGLQRLPAGERVVEAALLGEAARLADRAVMADVLRDEREQAAGERDAGREERAPARERREVPRLRARRRREGERDESFLPMCA